MNTLRRYRHKATAEGKSLWATFEHLDLYPAEKLTGMNTFRQKGYICLMISMKNKKVIYGR